mgnify:CR=1 FL=1
MRPFPAFLLLPKGLQFLRGRLCLLQGRRYVLSNDEDNALGRLPDARYAALDAQYAKEQEALSKEITELETASFKVGGMYFPTKLK